MKRDKEVILHLIVSEIKKGKTPATISKEQDIKKQTLQYYLRQSKEQGIIEKESYGVWKVLKEVPKSTKARQIKKQIRGHAFNWKVRFKDNIDWEKRLKDNNIKYQLIGINRSTPRVIFNNKKIWFTKTGLVIYEPQSFFSESSHTSKGMAVWELDKTVKALGRKLKINLTPYQFTTSREHYGMIKNELARQYNNKKEKLFIRDDEGIWMWIDDSHSLNELETDEPVNSRGVQNWYNDMKKTKFEVTPTFLVENINKLTENQSKQHEDIANFAEQLNRHIPAYENMGKLTGLLLKEIKNLREEIRNPKK